MNTQYYIVGKLVTCTVYNDKGMAFYASHESNDSDLSESMKVALEKAIKSRDEYKPIEAN
ncbi:hypothetical protein [Serratia fonticola]|uniref:hypothetical protein n=1 Tax=Serratia fonticola TaxID=47917 RepID=UPI003AAB0093